MRPAIQPLASARAKDAPDGLYRHTGLRLAVLGPPTTPGHEARRLRCL